MNGLEGVGEAVTGGMIARAVEPTAAGDGAAIRDDGHTHETACLNCGTRLTGEFCHRCGQHAHVHRSLGAFWHDIAHSVLHFEGKIWRTLPLLAFRPGVLTRRYIAGERARFVSPMALFLFSVFLMFAVFSLVIGPVDFGGTTSGRNLQAGMEEAARQDQAKIAVLERRRVAAITGGQSTAAIDRELKKVREEAAVVAAMAERGVVEGAAERMADDVPDAPGWFNKAYKKAKANPSLLIYKLQNNAYKFSWALIPLSVPFLWLLFPFSRRFRVYDHTVFVSYSLCFMTLLAILLSLLGAIGIKGGWLVFAAFVVPPIHMYKQLKHAYRLTRFSAGWRAILLIHFATIAVGFFGLLLIALGVLG